MTTPLDYAARGWYVFPCYTIVRGKCNCAKGVQCESPGKHPRTHNGVKDASVNPDVVQSWLTRWPDSNWAVATGQASGMIVIDIDPRKNGFGSIDELENQRPDGPLPETLRSNTGGAGRHLFYAYPDGEQLPNRTNWLPGVDVKSDGGYVILPEAAHVSGGRYTWGNWGSPLTPLPSDILYSFRPGSGGGSSTDDLGDTDSILQGVEEGARDNTLFRAACRWRRQLGDNRAAVLALARQAAANCDPPFPDSQVVKCVDSAMKQNHQDDHVDWLAAQQHELHNPTDLGNAQRFLDHFGDRVRYVEGWGWVSWRDTGWVRGADAYAAELTHRIPDIIREESRDLEDKTKKQWVNHAKNTEAAGRLNAITGVAAAFPQLRRTVVDFDSDDYLLNCANGIVDLRTGDIRMLDQDDLVTKTTNVIYDPSYKLDDWDDFLKTACEGDQDMMDYLQRAAGYTLTGSNAEEAFFIISGPAASGKSTFLDALHAALGSYGTTTQSETFMYRRNQQAPASELARFAGARLVSMSEVRESDSFDETLIKQFTGGDKVTARYLYQNAFEYRPQLKLWIGTNHDPDARDEALWRRLKKIPFRRSIPYAERNRNLKSILRDESTGGRAVLAWAVEGAKQWYANGLQQPSTITSEVISYRMEQDRFGQFMVDCLVTPAPGSTVPLNDMYETYKTWCKVTGEFPKRQPQFVKVMEGRGIRHSRDDRGRVEFKDVLTRSMTIGDRGVSWT